MAAAWKAEQEQESRLTEERAKRRKRVLQFIAGSIAACVMTVPVGYIIYRQYMIDVANAKATEGKNLVRNGEFDTAANLFKEALNIRMGWLGEKHSDTLQAEDSLAKISDKYFEQGKYDKSEPLDHVVLDASADH